MNIQIDTKAKTIQFLNEFTFKDLKELKNYISDVEDWKIIPYTEIKTYTVKENHWPKSTDPFKGWQLTTDGMKPWEQPKITYLADAINYNDLSASFKDTIKKINKGIDREKITEFVNTYSNKPEY